MPWVRSQTGCIAAIGGISPLAPGYERVLIAPKPGGGISWANSSLETPQGQISVEWSLDGSDVVVKASLPEGVSGVLQLPDREPVELSK